MNRVIHFGVAFVVLVVVIFAVLFLGGLSSAALEIRREKKAGLVPTRPAWENRDKRRAVGGFRRQIALAWQSARKRADGIRSCWCGRGPIVEFSADPSFPAGFGCAAWESGDPQAILRHDAAGGYKRTSTKDAAADGWGSGVDHIGGAV